MTKAKCIKCGGSAIADTYEQARNLINHAVGLSRGIKCGDNYNMVQEIKPKEIAKKTPETIIPVITITPKSEKTKPSSEKHKTQKTKSSV